MLITVLRNSLFLVYILIITSFFSLIIVFLDLLRFSYSKKILLVKTWSVFSKLGMKFFLNLSYKVENHNNFVERAIYVSNHQSIWETIVLCSLIRNPCFVVKKEILSLPLFGKALLAIDSIAIAREKTLSSLKRVIEKGSRKIDSGANIIIFPEGKRVSIGNIVEFHKSAFVLSKKTNCMVVPIAHNSGKFWPRKFGLIKPGCVSITFGSPIRNTKALSVEEIRNSCATWISNRIQY